ncbi:MAG TPA: hypothetical protein VHG92_06800 [Afifellaceae bacterium]|nr:hypothetical protein [Afifellaceae bacterium]
MTKSDELIEGVLRDGRWHQEQHLASHIESEHGEDGSTAFDQVIQYWNRERDRVERRYDRAVQDFQWRLVTVEEST